LAKISARGHTYHIFVDLERMMGFGMQLWARKKKKEKRKKKHASALKMIV